MTILNYNPTTHCNNEHVAHVMSMTTDEFIAFYTSLPKMSQNSLYDAFENAEYDTQKELDEELLNCDSFTYIEECHGYDYMTEYNYTSEYDILEAKLTKIKALIEKVDELKLCLK